MFFVELANYSNYSSSWINFKFMRTIIRGNVLRCLNCKGRHVMVLPMRLTYVVKVLKAFEALHKYCEDPKPKEIEKKE